ncbi:MAG: VanZ family protein [Spirochaetes bacterium]|nr:VanZ family protein [Spirochaetota bacterium]MBU1082064.1 VanZ family protein [Spirochaetota bacterium]
MIARAPIRPPSRPPVLTILVASLILVAVLLPGSAVPDGPSIPGFDKMVHFVMFLALAVAAHIDFFVARGGRAVAAVLAALAFSACTELAQLAVDGRSAELLDMAADMAGFSVGLAARAPLSALATRIALGLRRVLGRAPR